MKGGRRSFVVSLPRPRGEVRYPVVIGAGALGELPRLLARLGKPSRLQVVADARAWRAWGGRLEAVLGRAALPWGLSRVPPGERSKSVAVLERLWRDMARAGCDRGAWVAAFGGGVVGDLAGFAAASLLRGVDFIQLPTTLLAMVDASVGGKTGINLPEGKNLVGAFHQPRAVVMDLDLLSTLPPRELRAGLAEVVKTAAILDARLFGELERRVASLLRRQPAALARVVEACARLKAEVVRRDEREGGARMALNFGHTLAHGLEAARGYRALLHGEAVAIGMAFASRLGETLGVTARGTSARLEALLHALGLPTRLPTRRLGPVLEAMQRDKKRGPRGLRWVVLGRLGEARVEEGISWKAARAELARFAGLGGNAR